MLHVTVIFMNAKTDWKVIAADFPETGSAQQKLAHILKLVTHASTTEEWQPCRFKLKDDYIELSADPGQVAHTDDPDHRNLMIGCGAALFRLKLGLKYFGCFGVVETFPDLGNTLLVARLYCGYWHCRDWQEVSLFEAMTAPPTNSSPFEETPESEISPEWLKHVIGGEQAWLEFSHCESSRNLLLALTSGVRQSASRSMVPDAGRAENRLLGFSRAQASDSSSSWWTNPFVKSGDRAGYKHGSSLADGMANLAVIKTKTDDKHGWLATGQIRACIQLQAQASGMPARFFEDAFRKRFLREELRTAIGRKGFVQTIVGLGSRTDDWPSAPRAPHGVTITLHR